MEGSKQMQQLLQCDLFLKMVSSKSGHFQVVCYFPPDPAQLKLPKLMVKFFRTRTMVVLQSIVLTLIHRIY